MIPVTSFANKKVALFGLGGSGLASAQALVAGGAAYVVGRPASAQSRDIARQAINGGLYEIHRERLALCSNERTLRVDLPRVSALDFALQCGCFLCEIDLCEGTIHQSDGSAQPT